MPLTTPASRKEVHHRVIEMRSFARDDGLYDVEARLVDRKPFAFQRLSEPEPIPAGQPLHDLWVRMTIDGDRVVRKMEAASVTTPWPLCKDAESTLSALVGERVGRGWAKTVKARLGGAASCTHLMEMLIPMATVALQGLRGVDTDRLAKLVATGATEKLDTCFAYGRHREVVKFLWPMSYEPIRDDHEPR